MIPIEQIAVVFGVLHLLLTLRILKAIKGPEIMYHRKKRTHNMLRKIKNYIVKLYNKVKNLFKGGKD